VLVVGRDGKKLAEAAVVDMNLEGGELYFLVQLGKI
jgi:hypothetical protein